MRYPLVDLPLEKFSSLEHRTSMKRPLSPGSPPFSFKRRICSVDGPHSPKNRHQSSSPQNVSDIATILPASARKLDFTVPSTKKARTERKGDPLSRQGTPIQQVRASKLHPYPTSPTSSSLDASIAATVSPRDCHSPPTMLIPREIPLMADRQSIHWPGFDVHVDTHIAIPTSESTTSSAFVPDDFDTDDAKENAYSRKRARKEGTADIAKPKKLRQIESMETASISVFPKTLPPMTWREHERTQVHTAICLDLRDDIPDNNLHDNIQLDL